MYASSECPDETVHGSSELLTDKFCHICWHVLHPGVSNIFLQLRARRRSDFVPEEADFSSISKYILL